MVGAIDHTGVAVADLDDALRFYRDVLALPVVHRELVAAQAVEVALLGFGDPHLELLAPLSGEGGVARFLRDRGPGLHHLAYRVEDIDATLATLSAAGVRLIDARSREGVRGSRVAFLHPSASGGVLTEIVQPADQ